MKLLKDVAKNKKRTMTFRVTDSATLSTSDQRELYTDWVARYEDGPYGTIIMGSGSCTPINIPEPPVLEASVLTAANADGRVCPECNWYSSLQLPLDEVRHHHGCSEYNDENEVETYG